MISLLARLDHRATQASIGASDGLREASYALGQREARDAPAGRLRAHARE